MRKPAFLADAYAFGLRIGMNGGGIFIACGAARVSLTLVGADFESACVAAGSPPLVCLGIVLACVALASLVLAVSNFVRAWVVGASLAHVGSNFEPTCRCRLLAQPTR